MDKSLIYVLEKERPKKVQKKFRNVCEDSLQDSIDENFYRLKELWSIIC